jgi:hypothetical protein
MPVRGGRRFGKGDGKRGCLQRLAVESALTEEDPDSILVRQQGITQVEEMPDRRSAPFVEDP